MNNEIVRDNKTLDFPWAGTNDFASPVDRVRAIDLALTRYFGRANWLEIRDRGLPRLRPNR